ncbi:MAG: inositol monophosphatase [Candidatus Caldatribacterium sp.]|uniref:inositol monophosphatase family protein n=1 Tax=Candidatus Caldatribacterium sp. TaxID=2282143 RepID=UPI002995C758|nr:inositol monophosphatase [Candidatus Caldatribacterium sp.]MCX7729604.1 inositol monophosphatase [Candidatus Caldatribacterium sp.]MDW8081571.1 inositol monophosphatase family protein [Candidatus Calescibacterium sp.]
MLEKRLEIAKSIAQDVGQFILSRTHNPGHVEAKSSPIDVVTEVDKEAQRQIARALHEAFPEDAIWGEESGEPLRDFSHTWVIDPIDGTSNYVHGLPFYTVSIAYFSDGQPILGVLYAPALRELFWALRGKGAFCNGTPIRVSQVRALHEAIFITGFPHTKRRFEVMAPIYGYLLGECQALRSFGSAALGLAYVACGRCEGYLQLGISFYDVAAGVCLVEEAGGTIQELSGKPWSYVSRSLCASNGLIDLAAIVRKVLPEDVVATLR